MATIKSLIKQATINYDVINSLQVKINIGKRTKHVTKLHRGQSHSTITNGISIHAAFERAQRLHSRRYERHRLETNTFA